MYSDARHDHLSARTTSAMTEEPHRQCAKRQATCTTTPFPPPKIDDPILSSFRCAPRRGRAVFAPSEQRVNTSCGPVRLRRRLIPHNGARQAAAHTTRPAQRRGRKGRSGRGDRPTPARPPAPARSMGLPTATSNSPAIAGERLSNSNHGRSSRWRHGPTGLSAGARALAMSACDRQLRTWPPIEQADRREMTPSSRANL